VTRSAAPSKNPRRTTTEAASHRFEAVYGEHVDDIWRYARARVPDPEEARDVTSEVFTRAYGAWDRYDPTKGSVGAWLAGIAHHVVADWWRHRSRHPVAPEADVPEPVSNPGDAADEADARLDALALLRSPEAGLTDREREALVLRFAAGLSSAEVGAVLGISDAGARMVVHRAVEKLRGVIRRG
jgi:RNA polymerase sigma-70 factor (ECF subfamily)